MCLKGVSLGWGWLLEMPGSIQTLPPCRRPRAWQIRSSSFLSPRSLWQRSEAVAVKHGSLSPIVVPVKVIEKVRPDGLFAAFGADLKVWRLGVTQMKRMKNHWNSSGYHSQVDKLLSTVRCSCTEMEHSRSMESRCGHLQISLWISMLAAEVSFQRAEVVLEGYATWILPKHPWISSNIIILKGTPWTLCMQRRFQKISVHFDFVTSISTTANLEHLVPVPEGPGDSNRCHCCHRRSWCLQDHGRGLKLLQFDSTEKVIFGER